jgi:threonine/homoserine/homoserine lactone efflux protein
MTTTFVLACEPAPRFSTVVSLSLQFGREEALVNLDVSVQGISVVT